MPFRHFALGCPATRREAVTAADADLGDAILQLVLGFTSPETPQTPRTASPSPTETLDGASGPDGPHPAPETGEAVHALRAAGWPVLPLPPRRKALPPTGFTGADGRDADAAQVQKWLAAARFGNVAVRCPQGVVGIDCDDYAGKGGAQSLLDAELRLGPLPDGPRSGNRGVDDPSCHRWFRVPPGLKLHNPGPGVDLIQRHHRYAVVAPSTHPEGRSYEWFGTAGPDVPPDVSNLPELPQTWVDGLSAPPASGAAVGGRHDQMLPRAMAKVAEGDTAGLAKLRTDFVREVAGSRAGGAAEASAEFDRAVNGAKVKLETGGESAQREELTRWLPDEFWDARESLRAVRGYAATGMLCPDALLGATLCRVLSHIGPNVVLPPLVGLAPASLNTIVALVGKSGAGKSTTQAAANELAWSAAGPAVELGSGEGIPAAYYGTVYEDRPDPKNPDKTKRTPIYKQTRFRRAFSAAEVDGLRSLMERSGATLDAALRKLYSGEELGAAYSAKEKRHQIPPGHYRATVLIGVQPDHSAPLLSGSAATSGLAQRVLWLSAEDPRIETPVGEPPTWRWRSPTPPLDVLNVAVDDDGEPLDVPGLSHTVAVPGSVRLEIQAARKAQVRGEADPLDGHAGLTRLKVAAGLAVLDGRLDTVEEDWQLAGLVMVASAGVRRYCGTKLAAQMTDKAAAGGRMVAVRDDATDDERLRLAELKLARHIWRNHADGSVCPRRCQRESLGARKTDHQAARSGALSRGWVVEHKYTPSSPGAAAAGDQVGLVRGAKRPPEGGR